MDWKAVVGKVAPWIGTALGGPLGGMAVAAIADALGLDDKTESAIKAAIGGATPEQLLAVKQADQDFALKMQELGFHNVQALESIAAKDRDSARQLQAAQRSYIPAVLSIIVVGGYLVLLVGLMTQRLTVDDSQAMLLMLGALQLGFGTVLAFWFGTTSAALKADQTIRDFAVSPGSVTAEPIATDRPTQGRS